MASEHHTPTFPDEIDDDDDESQDEEEYDELRNNDDEEDFNSGSPSTSSPGLTAAAPLPDPSSTITVAIPGTTTLPNGEPFTTAATVIVDSNSPDLKRLEKKPLDDSRKLFQRLWTDEDEIGLLQGFLEYTRQRGSYHHQDTALLYDQIKSRLQLEFNKNQLVEKLRRLKKKYRNVVEKLSAGKEVSFKSQHDQATFEISRKIWNNVGRAGGEDNALDDDDSNPNLNPNHNPYFNHGEVKVEENVGISVEKKTPKSRKRPRSQSQPQAELGTVEKRVLIDGAASNNNNNGSNSNVVGLIEETVRSCLSPLFKELLINAACGPCGGRGIGGGVTLNPMPLSFGDQVLDEKWKKQQILELEVYSKRLELVQDQIKVTLAELRSTGGS